MISKSGRNAVDRFQIAETATFRHFSVLLNGLRQFPRPLSVTFIVRQAVEEEVRFSKSGTSKKKNKKKELQKTIAQKMRFFSFSQVHLLSLYMS